MPLPVSPMTSILPTSFPLPTTCLLPNPLHHIVVTLLPFPALPCVILCPSLSYPFSSAFSWHVSCLFLFLCSALQCLDSPYRALYASILLSALSCIPCLVLIYPILCCLPSPPMTYPLPLFGPFLSCPHSLSPRLFFCIALTVHPRPLVWLLDH